MASGTEIVLKRDYFVKRSQMKSILKTENFKGRWFELTPISLRYSDGTIESGIGKIKGQIALACITAVEETESEHLGHRANAFQVVYKADELNILYVMTQHSIQRSDWISAIRDACQAARAHFSLRYHPGVWLSKPRRFSCCDSINKRSEGCTKATWTPPSGMGRGASPPEGSLYNIDTSTHGSMVSRVGSHASVMRPLPAPPPQQQLQQQQQQQPEIKLLALYNYRAVQEDDLDLIKGEEYFLVGEMEGDTNWWKARNNAGQTGYIPVNYVQLTTSVNLEQYDWFYPNTSRSQSEEILMQDGREGVFLVRDSSQGEFQYTLSVFTRSGAGVEKQGITKHYHIKRTPEGQHFLADKHPFNTIPELIIYHKHNCAGLIVRLRVPPRDRNSLRPTCALGHDLKEIDHNLLDIKEELGCGQFGKVHRGIFQGTVEVAVKTMKEGSMLEEDFIEEAKTMMKLQHDNLVKLYGVCTKKRPILILTEFMKNGALLHYLRRHKTRLLANHETLVDMSMQVCGAMLYLEENNIIHRDLAARNCLVGDSHKVKVGDFGLARFVLDNEYTCSAGAKFPVKWSAPEVLNYTKFSSKSDVWAFGILMWEIFSGGESPYGKQKNADVVDGVCHRDLRPSRPPKCPEAVYTLMAACWHKIPDDRPNFSQLCDELNVVQGDREYIE